MLFAARIYDFDLFSLLLAEPQPLLFSEANLSYIDLQWQKSMFLLWKNMVGAMEL